MTTNNTTGKHSNRNRRGRLAMDECKASQNACGLGSSRSTQQLRRVVALEIIAKAGDEDETAIRMSQESEKVFGKEKSHGE